MELTLTLNEKLAVRFYARRALLLIHRVFTSWRSWAFRFSYHRQLLLDNFTQGYLARRFYGWRWVARSRAGLKLLLRRYWRRRIRHHFSWWKHGAKWLRVKQTLLPLTFSVMKKNVSFQHVVTQRWAVLRQSLAASMIGRNFLTYRLRKLFWAMRTINRCLKNKYFLKILVLRKHREVSRQAAEQETINILLRRAFSCLEEMMNAEGGDVIVQQYLNSVKKVMAQVQHATPGSLLAIAKVFPDNKEAPEFARLWTVRSKAMEVLKRRAQYTVEYSARTRFRFTYPPPYACEHCAQPFLMKAVYTLHRQRGCFVPKQDKRERRASTVAVEAVTQTGRALVRSFKKSIGSPVVGVKKSVRWKEEEEEEGRAGVEEELVVQREPSYVCWTLAEPIVSAALRPIADYLIVPQADLPVQQKQKQLQGRAGPEYDLDSDASNDETSYYDDEEEEYD